MTVYSFSLFNSDTCLNNPNIYSTRGQSCINHCSLFYTFVYVHLCVLRNVCIQVCVSVYMYVFRCMCLFRGVCVQGCVCVCWCSGMGSKCDSVGSLLWSLLSGAPVAQTLHPLGWLACRLLRTPISNSRLAIGAVGLQIRTNASSFT